MACTTVPLVFACFAPFRGYSTVFHPGALVVCMDCRTCGPPHSSSSGNSRRACKKQWLIIFCAIGNLHGPVEQLLALNVGERVALFAGLFRPNRSARFLLSLLWRGLYFGSSGKSTETDLNRLRASRNTLAHSTLSQAGDWGKKYWSFGVMEGREKLKAERRTESWNDGELEGWSSGVMEKWGPLVDS